MRPMVSNAYEKHMEMGNKSAEEGEREGKRRRKNDELKASS